MKRVIDGKVYNTDTAVEVCEVPNSYNPGDFEYENTSLFRSPKGVYFVAGEGGAKSRWAKAVGNNSWSGGEGLEVVDEAEAQDISERAGVEEADMIAAGFKVEVG